MNRFSLIVVAILCFLSTNIFSQSHINQPIPNRPNIVWITSEDNSKHYMSLFDDHGVETPHIAALADEGVLFTHAFSNAPVCSVARSTIISGCYAPRIGAQFHRKIHIVPMPGFSSSSPMDDLKMFPEYLREAGYYTTNNSKEDYNLEKSNEVWDESSKEGSWKNRKPGQPFFHVINITLTHESSLHFTRDEMADYHPRNSMEDVFVFPNHPNTELFKYTNSYYRDRIQMMDDRLGDIVQELEEAGEMDNTIIFYFGDHGGVLPGSKGYLYETGLHVPLVVYVPPKYRKELHVEAGSEVGGFVSFIDLGPTMLSLAGINVPDEMDGRPFLGEKVDLSEVNHRDETYSYADRFDEKYDMVRAIRKGKYKYIRSFQPFNVDGLMNNYRYRMLAYQEWESLYRAGKLNSVQSAFFEPRPSELLFDVETDPYETHNMANNPQYKKELLQLRKKLDQWMKGMPDLSFYPEYVLINEAFDNPLAFGQTHKKDIRDYINIANLALYQTSSAKRKLKKALLSSDPWQRYWGLIACTSLKDHDGSISGKINGIAVSDPIPLNRVQAALCLAMKEDKDPTHIMTEALYDAQYPAEGLLILNSIVLMRDWSKNLPDPDLQRGLFPKGSKMEVNFDFQLEKINPAIREEPQVQRRLEYLGLM